MSNLRTERAALVEAEYNSYDADSFPGSARWMKNKKDSNALAAFDAAHPEVLAEIKAEKAAKVATEKPAHDAEAQRLFNAGLI